MSYSTLQLVFEAFAFLFAISFHESAHAWSANRLGDPTARTLGRVSLNPIRHIDLVGTVLLPLASVLTHIPLIGWAKPTPVDVRRLRNPRRDNILVAVAGPVSNFLAAAGAALLLRVLTPVTHSASLAARNSLFDPLMLLIYATMTINVVLAVFNLIPIPPLDGSHILEGILPESLRNRYRMVEQFGFLILLALIWFVDFGRLFDPFLKFFDSLVGM